MTASFDHLHPKVREVAGKSVEERIAWLQVDRWVKLDRSEAALAQLEAGKGHGAVLLGWVPERYSAEDVPDGKAPE